MKLLFLIMFVVSVNIFAQTNPQPFDLSTGNYSFTQWDSTSAINTYPPNVAIHTSNNVLDTASFVASSNWTCPYNLTVRSRINGRNLNGISFRKTGNVFTDACGTDTLLSPTTIKKFPGALVLALNSLGQQNIQVGWKGRMYGGNNNANIVFNATSQTRIYGLKLQYRVGTSGNFIDIPSSVYSCALNQTTYKTVGSFDVVPAVTLPGVCNNQSIIQLRWVYYLVSGTSGVRPEVGLDDILVTSSNGVFTATATANGATSFCQGGSVQLSASTGNNYVWSNGQTSQSISVSSGGLYNVTVSDANGATAISNSINVVVLPSPSASISSNGPTTICNGNSVNLSANINSSYLWTPTNDTTQSIIVSSAGTYILTVTGANGCTASSAPVIVQVDSSPQTPAIILNSDGTLTCNSTSSIYNWYLDGNLISNNTQSFLPTSNGMYQVEVFSSQGCVSDTSSSFSYLFTKAIKINKELQLKAFPNPNAEHVFNFSRNISGEVYSAIGANVASISNGNKLNLVNVPSGVYFLRTTKGEILKLILQ